MGQVYRSEEGSDLGLYAAWVVQEAGGGLVFWHPKGATIRKIIEDFWKDEHIKQGYQLLYTPHMANLNLWKTSGKPTCAFWGSAGRKQ